MSTLIKNKEYIYNDTKYIITVKKGFSFKNREGKVFYNYFVNIYNNNKTIFSRPIIKYKTYWLNYFDYKGDIERVILKAFKSHEATFNELDFINKMENKLIKEINNESDIQK